MQTSTKLIKYSELVNRRVIDHESVEEIGQIAQILLEKESDDANVLLVAGFTTKKGGLLGGKKYYIPWSRLERMGDNILIKYDRHQEEFEKSETAFNLIDSEILTDTGDRVGIVGDYIIEYPSGIVTHCIFKSSGWRTLIEGTYQFAAKAITKVGPKRIIVMEDIVNNPEQIGGVTQKVSQAKDLLGKDLERTKQDLQNFKEGIPEITGKAKEITEKAKEKIQAVAEKAKLPEKAQAVAEKAQEIAEKAHLSEKVDDLKGKAQELAGKAQEKAQELAGELQAKAQELGGKGKAKTLTNQDDSTTENEEKEPIT